jgi:hypothetical protein
VKGFLVVGIVTDPYSGVVGRSRDRLDDPNGIRWRLFEKFFREGVVHDFSQIVFTRLVFWLFLPLLWIPSPDFIAIARPIAEIGRSRSESVHCGLFCQYQQPCSYSRWSIAF